MPDDNRRPFTIQDALDVRTFWHRCPIRLSPDGRLIAYSVDDRGRAQTWVVDVDSGQGRQVLPEAKSAWGPTWSPDGGRLALYADVGEGAQPWVWHLATGEARRISCAVVRDHFEWEVPQWLPDGSGVVCRLEMRGGGPGASQSAGGRPSSTATDAPTVRCFYSNAGEERDAGDAGRTTETMLARIDVSTGEVIRLASDSSNGCAVSPDGRHVATMIPVTGGDDLCVVPSQGGEVRTLARGVAQDYMVLFSWSPDSRSLAYRHGRDVAVVPLDGGEPRLLTDLGRENMPEYYEMPLWSGDGSFLLMTDRGTVWRVPVDGRELIDLLPERGPLDVRGIVAPGGGPLIWSPDGGESIICELFSYDGYQRGLARVDLNGGGVRQLSVGMWRLSDVPRFHLDACPDRGLIVFPREDATHPADLWTTDTDLSPPRRITDLNPQVTGDEFDAPRLLDWTGPDGHRYRSAFLCPPAHFGPPPHPTVFLIYFGRQAAINVSCFGLFWTGDNAHVFASRGYAVCVPDLVMSGQSAYKADSHRAVHETLACAVKSAVDSGLADPERLGLYGHSAGGYLVNVAVAGLDCFAAAASSAGWVDDVSLREPTTEEGGAGAEGPADKGSLFVLERITTPLLVLHGVEDHQFPSACGLFAGLRRLGKTAALAVYEGEEHCIGEARRANAIDFWRRVLDWFDRYLRPGRGE